MSEMGPSSTRPFPDGLSVARGEEGGRRAAREAGPRRAHDGLPVCAIGESRASATGVARSPSSTAATAGSSRYRRRITGQASGGCQLRGSRQSARPPSDLETCRLPRVAESRHDARPTPLIRFLNRPGISCAFVRHGRRSPSSARRSITGCRSTNTSAVWSTLSFTSSTPFLHPRAKKCGYLDLDEPFAGLFTQGMVCHQTYESEPANGSFRRKSRPLTTDAWSTRQDGR